MLIIMAGVGRLAKIIQLAVVTEVAGLAGVARLAELSIIRFQMIEATVACSRNIQTRDWFASHDFYPFVLHLEQQTKE